MNTYIVEYSNNGHAYCTTTHAKTTAEAIHNVKVHIVKEHLIDMHIPVTGENIRKNWCRVMSKVHFMDRRHEQLELFA